MKKLLIVATTVALSALGNAATVAWNLATGSGATYSGNAYAFFIVGQNGAGDAAAMQELLAGSDWSEYSSQAFGTGTINNGGSGMVLASASGKTLGAGTYTGYFVLFDDATVTANSTKYMVLSGAATLTKTVGDSTASVQFTSGNMKSSIDGGTWGTVAAPEPTSGLLLLLGVAGLALKRKRA